MSSRSSEKRKLSDTRPTTPPPRQPIFASSPPLYRSSSLAFSPRLPIRQSEDFSSPSRRLHLLNRRVDDLLRPSSPIATSEGAEAVLLGAPEFVETEGQVFVDSESEAGELEAFINESSSCSEVSLEDDTQPIDDTTNWSDDDDDNDEIIEKETEAEAEKSKDENLAFKPHARERLARILNGTRTVPKKWNMRKILTTLVHFRNDPRLRAPYKQFCTFAYQTMMTETRKDTGRWQGALPKENVDAMIKLRLRTEVENRYRREIQQLCKTPSFGTTIDSSPGTIDRKPLEAIVVEAGRTAPLLTSFILSVGPASRTATEYGEHILDMKAVAVLVILCRSAHRNNSNYFPLLIALYMYSAGARVDAITLLNHLGLSVSYDVLQKKLGALSTSSMELIREQSSNRRLVGTWDNFEYRENVHGERVGDTVKFCSVTMALWIKNGWRILPTGLTQSMWDPTRARPTAKRISAQYLYGLESKNIRKQCVWSHRFHAFHVAFPDTKLDFISSMPIIEKIHCRVEGRTEAFAFAPSMFSESSTSGNMSVFEDFNVIQMGIEKTDSRWDDWLTIWWGDLKTEIQMISMQNGSLEARRPYDRYQHIFPGLALWHLRFNYLKMVWEVFYPGRGANERSTLQWAADHWRRDKTTRPTDFHSLEDLTIHSYRARIIAILRSWIYEQAPELDKTRDNNLLRTWLSELSSEKWVEALEWLDNRMNADRARGLAEKPEAINDHWTNHIRFCSIMEPYLTLCYAIKQGDIGLLCHAIREVCIIMQAPSASKPKYAKALLRQVHIIDTAAAHPTLRAAYLASSLVNLRGESNSFYEMDLLLEHQNGAFKKFRADRGSSLQDSDLMFRQHALTVDCLCKTTSSMNKIVVGRRRDGHHPSKDASFDILSLSDQLYRARSTDPSGPDRGRIYYFSENVAPNLINEGLMKLPLAVRLYNESVKKNTVAPGLTTDINAADGTLESQGLSELAGSNEAVDELFSYGRDESLLTSDLSELFI